MFAGLALFVVHYCLLRAWTGAIMNLIEAGVVFVAYKKEDKAWAKLKFWPYAFVFLYITAGLLTSKAPTDFLPIVAQIFGSIAVWQTNPRAIRYIMLVPRPLWFVYNLLVGSYAGMTAEILILASVVLGIIRFDILGKSVKKTKK